MWRNDDNKKNLKQMPIKEILFDSREHNWKINKVESDKKTKEHKDLMFVIEDTNGNGFGGYCWKEIKIGKFHFDSNSFLFSLKRNNYYILKKYCIKKIKMI